MPGSERCILVLACGKGRRMGGPKAIMRVGGEAWWRVQMRRMGGVASVWVVSPEVEAALAGEADAPECRVVGDPDLPMFASVMAGLHGLAADPPGFVHVLPVDVPVPGIGVLRAIEGAAGFAGTAVPSFEGVAGHPISLAWAWVARTILPITDEAELREARLDELTAPCRTVVPVEEPCVRVNLNTPEAVRAWEVWKKPDDARGGDQAPGPRQ